MKKVVTPVRREKMWQRGFETSKKMRGDINNNDDDDSTDKSQQK